MMRKLEPLASGWYGFVWVVAPLVAWLPAIAMLFVAISLEANPASSRNNDALLGLLGASAVLALVACVLLIVMTSVFWYRAWETIQDGQARTTPGKAVGFLFIPLYNLYWMFEAVRGFAVDYNEYVHRHHITAPRLSVGLFTTACILQIGNIVIQFVPIVNLLYGAILYVLWLPVLFSAMGAVNALRKKGAGQLASRGPQRAFSSGLPTTPPVAGRGYERHALSPAYTGTDSGRNIPTNTDRARLHCPSCPRSFVEPGPGNTCPYCGSSL